jgi:hypothetical protein
LPVESGRRALIANSARLNRTHREFWWRLRFEAEIRVSVAAV